MNCNFKIWIKKDTELSDVRIDNIFHSFGGSATFVPQTEIDIFAHKQNN